MNEEQFAQFLAAQQEQQNQMRQILDLLVKTNTAQQTTTPPTLNNSVSVTSTTQDRTAAFKNVIIGQFNPDTCRVEDYIDFFEAKCQIHNITDDMRKDLLITNFTPEIYHEASMRWVNSAARALRGARKLFSTFHDPVEHVTGIEKRELLAHMAGDCDPFRIMCIKRGPGTRERPNLIPSAFNMRLMGCQCHKDCSHINYMWLHQGEPKRCYCGYWFELCPVAPL